MKVPLCRLEDIPEDGTKTADFFGREVLIFKVEGMPKAVLNICMHLGGPMKREGDKLVCQWHGAEFDLARGNLLKRPAAPGSKLIFLPTRIEGGELTYVHGE